MAIWSAKPFSNEFALDFVSGLSGKSTVAMKNKMLGVFGQALSSESPLITGKASKIPIEPQNVEALLAQLGSPEAVRLACDAVEQDGVFWIHDDGVPTCQQAFACCALIALAKSDVADLQRFGEAPAGTAGIVERLRANLPRALVSSALEFVGEMRDENLVVQNWFGAEDYPAAREELITQVGHVERLLR